MDDRRANRIAGWAGIAFSVLSLCVLPFVAMAPAPVLGASGAAFATYYAEHRVGFLVGNYLGIAAFGPGIVQLVVLASRFRRVEGPDGWLASLIVATGVFGYAVFACSLAVFQALPFLTAPTAHDGAHAMGTLATTWFALDGLVAIPLVLAVAFANREHEVLPAWFGRFSVGTATLLLAMSAGSMADRPEWLAGGGALTVLGFVAFFVWTFVLAVLFWRNRIRSG